MFTLRLQDMVLLSPQPVIMAAVMLLVGQPSQAAALDASHGRVCINREEQNGRANIIPVRIRIVDGDEATVIGGEGVCFDIAPGSYRMRLEWNWDDWTPPSHAYHSAPVSLKLKERRTETFQICPVESPSQGYGEPWWNLKRACRRPR
jgi:hypothetical protein